MTILLVNPPGLHELAEGDEITVTPIEMACRGPDPHAGKVDMCSTRRFVRHRGTKPQQPPTASTGFDASFPDLHNSGAFGFPQRNAIVICDRTVLRFSVWNNDQYLLPKPCCGRIAIPPWAKTTGDSRSAIIRT